MSFKDLLGNQQNKYLIQNALRNNHLSSSLLFHGKTSCGKLSYALQLAKALNCEKLSDDSCDTCNSCRKIDNYLYPDIIIINTDDCNFKLNSLYHLWKMHPNRILLERIADLLTDLYYRYSSQLFIYKGSVKTSKKSQSDIQDKINDHKLSMKNWLRNMKSQTFDPKDDKKLLQIIEYTQTITDSLQMDNIPIETIRNIIQKLYIKPTEGRNKVIIINGLEKMKEETANTFLKSIEEPPPNNYLILITDSKDSILPTILSRCFILPFRPLSFDEQRELIQSKFNIPLPYDKSNTKDIWDIISDKDESSNFEGLINEFVNKIAPNYQTNGEIFDYVDKINSLYDTENYLKAFSNYILSAKKLKYALSSNGSKKNSFEHCPNLILDEIVREGEIILYRVKHHNLNPQYAMTGYLMNIASLLKKKYI